MVNTIKKVLADGTIKEYRYERGKPKKAKTEAVTFGYALREWCKTDDYKTLKDNTRVIYGHTYGKMVSAAAGFGFKLDSAPVAEFTTPRLIRMMDSFQGAPGTANSAITIFNKIFKFCVNRGWIQFNPAREINRPQLGERRPWSQEELEAFDKGSHQHYHDVFRFAILTGQRAEDMAKAKWTDIEDGHLHIEQSKFKRGEKPSHVWIPVTGELKTFLDELRSRKLVGQAILLSGYNRPWTRTSIIHGFGREMVRLGMANTAHNGVSLHGLRHTFATTMRENGATDEWIMSITGHKNPRVLQRYSNKYNRKKVAARAAEIRDAAFSGFFNANQSANRSKKTFKLLKLKEES